MFKKVLISRHEVSAEYNRSVNGGVKYFMFFIPIYEIRKTLKTSEHLLFGFIPLAYRTIETIECPN